MKKVLLTTLSVITLAGSSYAVAGGLDSQTQAALQKGGAYVGVDLGYADQTMPSSIVKTEQGTGFVFTNPSNDFSHFTVGAHVGYLHQLAENVLVGAEFGYQYLPNSKYTVDEAQGGVTTTGVTVKYKDYAFDLMGVVKYYFNDNFNVFGKVGAVYVNQQVEITRPSNTNTTTSSLSGEKVKPKIAVGAGYKVTPHLELTAQYSHIFGDKVDAVNNLNNLQGGTIPSNNSYLVGANYYFNV